MSTTASVSSELAFLFHALKAPRLGAALPQLAERARAESWSYEQFLATPLEREVFARQQMGGEARIRAAGFPARKTLEGFDFTYQTSVKKAVVLHLGQLDFITAKDNVVFLGPPGTGKTHLATALGIEACLAGHRVLFASATTWVTRLAAAQREHRLDGYLRVLDRYPLLIVDEVGHLPFDAEAASLFFQLVNARYERGSLIVTSNKPFTAWGEVFGDPVVAGAMLDRLVHHAEINVIDTIRNLVNQGGAQNGAMSSCRGIRCTDGRWPSSAADHKPTPKSSASWSCPTSPRSATGYQSAG